MEALFSRCSKLTNLPDISKWDISNLKNINGMFFNCLSLTTIPDLSNWKSNNNINIDFLFEKNKINK